MRELLAALDAHWCAQGIAPAPGASSEAVRAFEARCGVRLPADVRAYFEAFNGTGDDVLDREFVAFWSLDRVRTVAEELGHQEPVPPPADAFYCFADYSVWCNAYAVRLSADGGAATEVVAVYSGVDLIPVAPSFADFLRGYLGPNPAVVLHPRWEKDGHSDGVAP